MGKVLIIKGADFSGVSIDDIISNSENLTKENRDKLSDLYISQSGIYTSGENSYLYRLYKGDTIAEYAESSTSIFSFTNDFNPIEDESVDFANSTSSRIEVLSGNGKLYTVQNDCILNVIGESFPDIIKVVRDMPTSLTTQNYWISRNYEIINNAWSKHNLNKSLVYVIKAGYKITIKSSSSQKSIFALLNSLGSSGSSPDYVSGESRHDLPAGEQYVLTPQSDCFLYVMNETGYFPESIIVELV